MKWSTVVSKQSPLAEKYNSWSGYNYALNNPVLFIDPDGREIDISELMKSKDHAKAFMLFAKTKEGKAFLNNYASAGQKLEYGGKVFYQAGKEAGKFDKEGINLNYSVGESKTGSSTSSEFRFEKGKDVGLDINIEVAIEGFGSPNKTFNLTEAIAHESFLHGDSKAEDFTNNGLMDKSNLPSDYKKYGNHADHYFASMESLYNQNGSMSKSFGGRDLSTMQEVSKSLNLNYTNTQIKTQIWNFSGSLIQVNPKTGALNYKK
ncbi:MAG: hypothetical protein PHC28_16240 [Flavobacterium sp.]|uniref:hypothetical protein n=1 Tax=Flavobacterium sp. TaxID=239 RepID=UPI002633FCEC|nr:hypothetical protein [Flavobacterium sp.]MDD5152003.1 hypothetical protein [Flavobacterium sp.]